MASNLSSLPTKLRRPNNLTSFPTKLSRADQSLASIRDTEHRLYLECSYLARQSKWLSDDQGNFLGLIRLQVTLRVPKDYDVKWVEFDCQFDGGAEITNDIQSLHFRGNISGQQHTVHFKLAPEVELNVAGAGGSFRIGDAEWDHVRQKQHHWRFQCERRANEEGIYSLYSMEFRDLNARYHDVEPFRVCLAIEHEELPIPVSVSITGKLKKGILPFRILLEQPLQRRTIHPRRDTGSVKDEILNMLQWVREPPVEIIEREYCPPLSMRYD